MVARNTFHCTDLLTLCAALPDASVDMVLCDLPYGTTKLDFDTVTPFEPMWEQFKRVIVPAGAIVLTASQPFTSALVMSNVKWFRYEWIWVKNVTTGFLDANRKPMKRHESILVFSGKRPAYYPQMSEGEPYTTVQSANRALHYGQHGRVETVNAGERYPTSVLEFENGNANAKYHPTQKPVALFEYLIRTYTQPGELVLDPCVGSGTTAIAAKLAGRDFIVGDTSAEYIAIAQQRVAAVYGEREISEQTGMFGEGESW